MQTPQVKYRSDYKAPDYTITHIDLDFDLFESKANVIAKSHFKQLSAKVNSLELSGEGITLKRLEINGQAWEHYTENDSKLVLTNLPIEFELLVETQFDPSANTLLEGLYFCDNAYCTQCEAEGFRHITYYLDRPDVLATFTTTIRADKKRFPYLLSNGNKIDSGNLENDRHWIKWKDPHAKPCYLFALVAGDFDLLQDSFVTKSGREVALEIYVEKGNKLRAVHAMDSLKLAMKWDETRFDLEYDLDVYMIFAVNFFNMGAMENKGLNVFNSKYVLANAETATDTDYYGIESVIGHEYFHNWTGNRVTCRDWFQLSLKEGLTVFRDQEFSSDVGSRSVNRINNVRLIRGPQFAEDCGPMAHPVRPEKVMEMNNFYTLTVYRKGSEVIRMIHTLLGEINFQKGMKLYIQRHDGGAATCEDFVVAMEDASGVDLEQFRLWYSQSGTPELTVTSHYDEQDSIYTLTVNQLTPATRDQQEKQPLLIPFNIELYDQEGQIIELQRNGKSIDNILHVKEAQQTFVFDKVAKKPVISMLRDFSAPVKLHYDYSDQELTFLMKYATNDFSRWDAGQILLAKYIKQNVKNVQEQMPFVLPQVVVDAFHSELINDRLDFALRAEMLKLPSENEIAGWFPLIDVEAIHQVHRDIKKCFAQAFEPDLTRLYEQLKQDDYHIDEQAMGKRQLRNKCLSYLALTEKGSELILAHFNQSNNMTDTIAALTLANNGKATVREALMQQFSEKWQHDGLVMDKWFELQGTHNSDDALENVKAQMSHPSFSLKNPNRIRALIGSFSSNNPLRFHAIDGAGYQFLSEIVMSLNETNPQIASKLIDPLLKFNRFAEPRKHLMREQLEMLAKLPTLTVDLYEKITNALES